MQYVIGFLVLLLLSLTGCGGTISGHISSDSSTLDVILSTDKMTYDIAEGEDIELRVSLDQVLNTELSVYWALEDPNASGPFGLFGTSLSSYDFLSLSGSVTVPAGQKVVLLKISSLADLTYENDEEFDLVLTTKSEKEHRVKVKVTDLDSKPAVSLSAGMVTEGQTAAIQVNFSKRSAYKTTLSYEIVPGTGTLGAEFASLTGTFEVEPNTLLANLSIAILDDGDIEGNEYFQIRLTAADYADIDNSLVSVTVLDDEDGPKLKVADQTIDESGGTLRVKVTYTDISQVRTLPVYFDWSIIDDSATLADADFVASGGTGAVIYPNENEIFLDIPIIDDLKYELDESFNVVISNVINAGLAADTAIITVTDNDPLPEIAWEIAQTSALEGAFGTFSIKAKLNQNSGFDVNATVTTSGTATAQDFSFPTTQITIPAGSTEASFVVQIVEDSAVASDKELILTLGGFANAQAGSQLNHTIEIIDDDGDLMLFVSNTSINESAGTGSVMVSLSKPLEISESVDFSYSAADGSAGALDYTLTAGSATINGGESSFSIPITINDDSIFEGNEQLTVSVSSSDPDVSIQPGSETGYVTIVDNDSAPIIEFAQASSTAAENVGSAVTITVNKTGQTTSTSTVSYIIGGTATYASDGSKDHRLSSGTVTFLSGETSKTISVVIDDDSLQEGGETIVVTLVNPTSATLGSIQAHTLTITDDESLPHISVAGASTTEGTNAEFTVTLTVTVGYPVTVDYVISDGTAISPDDHAGGSGQLTIYPGDGLSKKIYVATVDDALYEGDETLDITISNPDPSSIIIDTASDASTIVDNEGTPTLTISDATITEGSPGTVTVTVNPISTQAITVDYASSDTTATAGADYTALSGTLSISAGDSTAVISITTSDDSVYEGDESFAVALSNTSVGSQLGSPSTGTVTITDNESAPEVEFSVASQTVSEGDGSLTISIVMDRASASNVSIPFTLSGTATEGAGQDYTISPSSPVTLTAGQTQVDLTVTLNDDAVNEGTENIIVSLGTPTGAALGTAIAHTITVEDNEPASVSEVRAVIVDGCYKSGQSITVEVEFSEAITVTGGSLQLSLETGTTDRTVTLNSGNGTAVHSGTYTVQSGDMNVAGLDYVSVNALTLSAGSAKNSVGIDADLTLPALATDSSISRSSNSIKVDTEAPSLPSLVIEDINSDSADDDWYRSLTASPVISFTDGNDGSGCGMASTQVRVLDKSNSDQQVKGLTSIVSGNSLSGMSLTDGHLYKLEFMVTDMAGNSATQELGDGWTVDSVNPTGIGAVSKIAEATNKVEQTPTFSFTTATDADSGLAGYQIQVHKSSDNSVVLTYTLGAGNASSFLYDHGSTIFAFDTEYYANIRAVDSAGNVGLVSTSPTWSYIENCDPGRQEFVHTGSLQTFNVPSGCHRIYAKVWGAAGGGATFNGTVGASGLPGRGGPGGFSRGIASVTPGDTLNVIVGSGGQGGVPNGTAQGGYGGGGNGGGHPGYSYTNGGAGGGRSAIEESDGTPVIVAGGGGGSPSDTINKGGAGGGASGGDGDDLIGSGATSVAPGTGAVSASNGVGTQGGNGTTVDWYGGGGGGGGLYGGGGGSNNQGGGGGSGYAPAGGETIVSSDANPPKMTDQDYQSGIGVPGGDVGKAQAGNGGNGIIIVYYGIDITDFYPLGQSTSSGGIFTLEGQMFEDGSQVYIGSVECTGVTVSNEYQKLTCSIGANTAGTKTVKLIRPSGKEIIVTETYQVIDSCSGGETSYSYTGSDITATVPMGCTRVRVKAWAAGGGGASAKSAGQYGGPGGYVEDTGSVYMGKDVTVLVGGGGKGGNGTSGSRAPGLGGYGGGGDGAGSISYSYTLGGGGGGLSGILDHTGQPVVVAAGGGGAAASNGAGSSGGAGGSDIGSNGGGSNIGAGGTQSAGGNAGTARAGSLAQGGIGYIVNWYGGGGGGAGYYGGGGGGDSGAGGGGSNLAPSGSGTSLKSASGNAPPMIADSEYPGGNVGYGGASVNQTAAQDGGNGFTIIEWLP